MEKGRLKYIISGLSRYELTSLEKRFIEGARHSLEKHCGLTEQQESILEGLYMEKTRWIKKGIINLANKGYSQR
jgi:hypothetical protein